MTPKPILTDATLESTLVRRSGHTVPPDLAEAIGAAVARTPQARRMPWTRMQPSEQSTGPTLRVAWMLTILGLLLVAALSIVLVGSELLRRTDDLAVVPAPTLAPSTAPTNVPALLVRQAVSLTPTGVIEATGTGRFSLAGPSALVVGPDGVTWALGSGRLLRIATDGGVRDWTLVDDAVFGRAHGLAASRFGGVWILDSVALRLFDGSTFTDIVAAPPGSGPPGVMDALEAPDGQLWVTGEAGVSRWDGTTWTALPWRPDWAAGEIAFDAQGRPWVGLFGMPGRSNRGVAMFDGTAWTEFYSAGPRAASAIAAAPDGSVWFGTGAGPVHFDGTTWTDEHPFDSSSRNVSSVAAGSDGTIWVAAAGICVDCGSMVLRFDGSTWQRLDTPRSAVSFGDFALLAEAGDGVIFANDAGVYRISGAQWSRLWPVDPTPLPGMISVLAAVSADEVFAGSGDWDGGPAGVWRYRGGIWERDTSVGAPDHSIRSLVLGPGGSLWAGSEGGGGVQVLRDGTWTSVLEDAVVSDIAPLADGTVWVAAGVGGLMLLHPDGETWRRETISGSPLQTAYSVAATSDGTIWASAGNPFAEKTGGLARFDGRMWHQEYPLGEPPPAGGSLWIHDMLAASDGSLWVTGTATTSESPTDHFAARFAAGRWTVYDAVWANSGTLAELPDGSILIAGDGVSTVTDGRRNQELAGQALEHLSVAPDGAVWVVGRDVYRIR